ncbi:NAD-dependent epimerase/dehydratase family protein [Geomonas subterranea]|uniref:NAD-dependent epimerase/dehydratase family protein n=1 Tax=Geomonas subterranea TaxID=2847989 RepID=A0ABX8LJ98_9BACT|nr:NAD-dependent epimerase/dehydratase family protein [Geomonas subterranea]QXE91549.1 NAD-dependent epimerase/dehydratase family protein [Geomonas subterranea]QXM10362.1 NAD-dependent epimerase/dehydratase family protein [Geomonas subterranea]
MQKRGNCLVLGGCGFIGSHLSEALLACGHFVRIFDKRNVNTANIAAFKDRVELVTGDFMNEDELRGVLKDIDVVVHLVSMTLPKSSNDNMIYDVETNLSGTLRLLNLARQQGVSKVVYASSGGTVYGVPQFQPITESHPVDPLCSYGITKLATEKYLHLYRHLYGLDYTVLRIANPYGERQDPASGQGAVTTFVWRALSGEPIVIWGDGSVARDFLHISDLVDAFLRVIHGGTPSRVYNIGCGEPCTLNRLVEVIGRVTGTKPSVEYKPVRKLDVPVNYLDVTLAREELGWTPRLDLDQGIARLARYVRAELNR